MFKHGRGDDRLRAEGKEEGGDRTKSRASQLALLLCCRSGSRTKSLKEPQNASSYGIGAPASGRATGLDSAPPELQDEKIPELHQTTAMASEAVEVQGSSEV